jgi:hypothetical protein
MQGREIVRRAGNVSTFSALKILDDVFFGPTFGETILRKEEKGMQLKLTTIESQMK